MNFIDTALGYGNGHSETLVGQVVREAEGAVYVATKIPPKNSQWPARPGVPANEAYPADWVVQCTERSLANLGLETIDVQQFHVWSDEWVGQGDWAEAVERLRSEGKIRYFGVSINDHQAANAVKLVGSGLVDTVQVIYNIFDQSPADQLFAAVKAANVGVIVRVPFDEGGLTGKVTPETEFPDGDFRNNYFSGDRKEQVWERVQAIAKDLGVPVQRLPEIALRFCISHPAVSTVIPGMRSQANVDANAEASTSARCRPGGAAKYWPITAGSGTFTAGNPLDGPYHRSLHQGVPVVECSLLDVLRQAGAVEGAFELGPHFGPGPARTGGQAGRPRTGDRGTRERRRRQPGRKVAPALAVRPRPPAGRHGKQTGRQGRGGRSPRAVPARPRYGVTLSAPTSNVRGPRAASASSSSCPTRGAPPRASELCLVTPTRVTPRPAALTSRSDEPASRDTPVRLQVAVDQDDAAGLSLVHRA